MSYTSLQYEYQGRLILGLENYSNPFYIVEPYRCRYSLVGPWRMREPLIISDDAILKLQKRISDGWRIFKQHLKGITRQTINFPVGDTLHTCLSLAAERGDLALVKLLIRYGALVNMSIFTYPDKTGESCSEDYSLDFDKKFSYALVVALQNGHTEVANFLRSKGAYKGKLYSQKLYADMRRMSTALVVEDESTRKLKEHGRRFINDGLRVIEDYQCRIDWCKTRIEKYESDLEFLNTEEAQRNIEEAKICIRINQHHISDCRHYIRRWYQFVRDRLSDS